MTEPFIDEIQEFEKTDSKSPPVQGGVLFVGSSTIKLWPSLNRSFPDTNIINRGFGGSQIEDSIRYAKRIITPYKPKLIIFYAGDNDLASGKIPDQVLADYRLLVETIRSQLPCVCIVYISIKPSPSRVNLLPDIRKANTLIEAFIKTDNLSEFVDLFNPMLGPDSDPRPELFTKDMLHMNMSGYQIWNQIIAPYVSL